MYLVSQSLGYRQLCPPLSSNGVCSHLAHLWATSDFIPLSRALKTPEGGKGHVATRPTCGRFLILYPVLMCRGPPKPQGL